MGRPGLLFPNPDCLNNQGLLAKAPHTELRIEIVQPSKPEAVVLSMPLRAFATSDRVSVVWH